MAAKRQKAIPKTTTLRQPELGWVQAEAADESSQFLLCHCRSLHAFKRELYMVYTLLLKFLVNFPSALKKMLSYEFGVIEYGTTISSSTMWGEMPIPSVVPRADIRKAFEELGALYCIFWQEE